MARGTGAVFLDRDGTLIEEADYLRHPDQVQLFPWTIDAVRALNRAGVRVVLATNQSGVARGFFDEAMVRAVHDRLADLLRAGGAYLDAYYYCPHHPDGRVREYARVCDCRKPGRGLVDKAVQAFAIDPARSFIVGDRWLDVALARAVGGRGILVRTGYGAEAARHPVADVAADAVADNLAGAASWILERLPEIPQR